MSNEQVQVKSSPDTIVSAGDVNLSEVLLYNASTGVMHNITPQVIGINLYESLNNIFVQGDICLIDTQNLTNLFPLTGNELINFKFQTPGGEEYVKNYVVVGLSEKAKRERESTYTLSIISAEAVIDRNTRISKKFSGNAGEIVKELLQYYKSDVVPNEMNASIDQSIIEPSLNSISFISNWWSPSKCIKYIQERAIDINGMPTYIFFENIKGLHFMSIQSIFNSFYQTGPTAVFVQDNLNKTANHTQDSTVYKTLAEEYQRMISPARLLSGFDYFKRLREGFYGSELVGYDLTTGQYIHNKYNNIENYITLNQFKPLTNIRFGTTAGRMNNVYKSTYHMDGYDSDADNPADQSNMRQVMTRDAIMARLNNSGKLVIEVNGHTNYGVGQIVHVKIPKDQQILKDEDPWDNVISGNYFICEIRHTISVGAKCKHTCVMNLCKDSYMTSVE